MRIFGYGSLVNRRTHRHSPAVRATVPGWVRVWTHTAYAPRAILSVEPAPGRQIDGLALPVKEAEKPALFEREKAYDMVTVEGDLALFTIPAGKHPPADEMHPILYSYLEVVVQGYLAEFGERGVAEFFDSTNGWDAPLLDDRADPIYPRAQKLGSDERDLVEAHVTLLGLDILRI